MTDQRPIIYIMANKRLVYYESYGDIASAIEREKQIKAGSRKNKLTLIESMNPKWLDLYETLLYCLFLNKEAIKPGLLRSRSQ